MAAVLFLLLAVAAFLALGMARVPLWGWAAAVGLLTLVGTGGSVGFLSWLVWLPFVALALLSIPSLRRSLVVAPVYGVVQKILPKVSDT
jgi:acyl-CoA dehydrogenase